MSGQMSDAKFLEYMDTNNLREFLRYTQYSIGMLESQPIEKVTKILRLILIVLKEMTISRRDPALRKERAITYKLMHNVLIRKIKRRMLLNPEEMPNRVIIRNSPEILDMAIIKELDTILPDLISDCVADRVPLDGLLDLRKKVAEIKAAYDTSGFRVIETKLRF